MSSTWEVLRALAAEVEGRIAGLTPNGFDTKRFRRRPAKRRTSPIDKDTGTDRLFECGRGVRVPAFDGAPQSSCGTSNRAPIYHIPISIVYRAHDPNWRQAALDDADEIEADLANHWGSAPSGVQNRWIINEPVFTPFENDDWEVMTLTLEAILDVD